MDLNRLNELANAMSTAWQKSVKGVFYSASGNGKSHLAMEVADKITPPEKAWLLVDTSDNHTIADQINNGSGPQKPWTRLPFTFIEDLENIAEAIAAGVAPFNSIGTIILDEGSKMAKQDVDRIFDQRQGEGKTIEETPGWGEYRPGMIRYRRMLAKLMAVPGLNVLVVAHETGPVKNLDKIHADFPIATYTEVKGNMTFVARVTADEKTRPGSDEAVYERTIQIHPTKAYDAKSRLGTNLVKMPTDWFPDLILQWLSSQEEYTEITEDQQGDDVIKQAPTEEEGSTEPDTTDDNVNLDMDFDSFKVN